MPNNKELKQAIQNALAAFGTQPLADAARGALATLGYKSNKTLPISPNTADGFQTAFGRTLKAEACASEWLSVDLLFQVSEAEIHAALNGAGNFAAARVDNTDIRSYLFFAVELRGEKWSRAQLSGITREINKAFDFIPALILFKHGNMLSLGIIARRLHKKDGNKDVLEKVTIIKDIAFANPHRAHLDILHDLAIGELQGKYSLNNFDDLQKAWDQVLDTSALNKKFFREVADWYFWAADTAKFPKDAETQMSVIRLITRVIFIWFIKEMGLVPEDLFDERKLKGILLYNDPKKSNYYKAILQNLFFATLNTEMGADRKFRGRNKNADGLDQHHGISTVYRYEDYFKSPKDALKLFANIPFLNGGLFECLDKPEEKIYIDGFSDTPKNQPVLPDDLFFGAEREVDLSAAYGDTHHSHEKVRGLIQIFKDYKFTVEENTPIEEEVALDPELLGKVFENLLAAYNPETGSTARKQTGSFYTPREIVNYMVDEALIAYLESGIGGKDGENKNLSLQDRLRLLFAYNNEAPQFNETERGQIIESINALKAFDPACGSGAFPMGLLHKLVFILKKLDPDNTRWREFQVSKVADFPELVTQVEDAFKNNHDDYGRKLYLIQNCIYGVDIQPIAVQIAKLRFFISLVVEQKVDEGKLNRGIQPLPNLETKFVAANTLIGLQKPEAGKATAMSFGDMLYQNKRDELQEVRKRHFSARTKATKEKHRQQDKKLRAEISDLLKKDGWGSETAQQLAGWDPYDQNAHADFFDPEWMFGIEGGFDVVIGNPPYIQLQKDGGRFGKMFKTAGYNTFELTGDIYSLFYERGWQILKQKGALCFITSNKWMRSGYGESTRKFFAENTNPILLIDFAGQKVFDAATVDVNILMFSKDKNQQKTLACIVKEDALNNLSVFVRQQGAEYNFSAKESWVIISPIEQSIKRKIEAVGTPLKDWDINIYRGVLTGYNEAFIIDGETKDKLIKEDPKSAEIIRPILRGRDIKRYGYEFADLYLIATFPSLKIDIEKYPAIKKHLLSFGIKRLEQTGKEYKVNGETIKARKKTANKWFETQDSISYWDDFSKQKIVWIELTDHPNFYLDEEGYFINNTVFFINGNRLPYVLSFLNSRLCEWYFTKIAATSGAGTRRWIKIYIEQICIPIDVSEENEQLLTNLITEIQIKRKSKTNTQELERKVDLEIFKLFDLTAEEIAFIDAQRI